MLPEEQVSHSRRSEMARIIRIGESDNVNLSDLNDSKQKAQKPKELWARQASSGMYET